MRYFISGEDGSLARAYIKGIELEHVILNDKLEKTWKYSPNRVPEVNVLDPGIIEKLREFRPDVIVHTAALVNTDKCDDSPDFAYLCNVETTYNLVMLARDLGAYFVYFSTSAIYDPVIGDTRTSLFEGASIRPRTLYGKTKWQGELIARGAINAEKLLVVRPSFVYGGPRDNSSTLAKIIRDAIQKGPGVTATLNPKNQKTFTHIVDFTTILSQLISTRATGVFNISSNLGVKFESLLSVVEREGLVPNVFFLPSADYLGNHIVNGSEAMHRAGFDPVTFKPVPYDFGVTQLVTMERKAHGK